MRRTNSFVVVLSGVSGASASLVAWMLVAHLAHTTMLAAMAAALFALVAVTPLAALRLAARLPGAGVMALSFLVALAVAPLACCVVPPWVRGGFVPGWGFQRRFDRAEWLALARSDDPDSARGEMVADLTRPGLVLGRTRDEVRALLGPPSWPDDDTGPDVWIVGMWSGFGIDEDGLVVVYDEDDVAVEIFTRQY